MIFVETPTNPILALTDLEAMADLARRRAAGGRQHLCESLQRPIVRADLVTHSDQYGTATATASASSSPCATRTSEAEVRAERGRRDPRPFDSWLVLRGTRRSRYAMQQHNINGLAIAQFLARTRKCATCTIRAFRRTRTSSPGNRCGFRRHGGVRAGPARSRPAPAQRRPAARCSRSLRGVETLISHPATMTHASVPEAPRHWASPMARTDLRGRRGHRRTQRGSRTGSAASEPVTKDHRVLDFLLHSDRHLLESSRRMGVGVWILFAIVFAETGFVTLFLPGRFPALRDRRVCATGACRRRRLRAPRTRRLHGKHRELRRWTTGRPARVQPATERDLSSSAEPRSSQPRARILRAVRRQGYRARPLRPDRPHLRAVRRRRGRR